MFHIVCDRLMNFDEQTYHVKIMKIRKKLQRKAIDREIKMKAYLQYTDLSLN